MKKRLLITSIVMMLVVAVALSTATYAWFTSNARVDATSITLKADTSSATALGIGWADGDAGTSIEANVSDVLVPMAPVALTIGTTTARASGDAAESDIVFKTQTTKQEDSQFVFNGAGESAVPVTYNNGTVKAFYVKNLSPKNTISSITLTAVFGSDAPITNNEYTYTALAATDTFAASGTDYYKRIGNVYVKQEVLESGSTAGTNQVVAGATAGVANTYYTANAASTSGTADNMIRVAVFRKGASEVSGKAGQYSYTDGDYTLLGVLGNVATAYTVTADTAPDKNKTYYTVAATAASSVTTQAAFDASPVALYTLDNGVYTKASSFADSTTYYTLVGTQFTGSSFENGTKYYTAANTAVYGSITEGGAVKNLSNREITTSLQLVTGGALGSEQQIDLMVVVWLDGTVFDDTRAGDIGSVSLKFNA